MRPPRDHEFERRRWESEKNPVWVKRGIRVLPHNIDAEQSILGGIIIRNEVLALLADLEVEDFYDLKHRVIFSAIRNLEARTSPIDVVTLEAEIEKVGKLDAIGGIAFLGELALRVPTADNVEAYAQLVTGHRITREVMLMLSSMLEEGFTGLSEGEQLVHDVTSALMTIRTGGEDPVVTMAQLISEEAQRVIADCEARASGALVYAGIPTGITAIDHNVGGHPIGIMSMYIGRPGMGKSTVSMSVAAASSRIADMDSLLASYEDSGQSFGQRGLAQNTGIATDILRARRLNADDLVQVGAAAAIANARSELLLSCAGMSVEALARRVRRENVRRKLVGRKPIRQLIVDYLQKMPLPDNARTRDDGISHISQALTRLAVSENMAVVAMAQLNREVEKRDDHRPRVSDIRDSGSLEQDAKLIVGLFHPYYYDPDKHPDHELHLLVLKNHQGENQGDILMYWDRKRHALYNTELEYQQGRMTRHRAMNP